MKRMHLPYPNKYSSRRRTLFSTIHNAYFRKIITIMRNKDPVWIILYVLLETGRQAIF